VIERYRILACRVECFVDLVKHLEEGGFWADIGRSVRLEFAIFGCAGLSPDLQ
jgi:hypothetical protein